MIDDCSLTKNCIQLNEKYYNDTLKNTTAFKNKKLQFTDDDKSRFWVEMIKKDKNAKLSKTGLVKMQIDVVPLEMAQKNPVGKARDSPNHSPTLPQPEGRISLSLNPFDMWKQLIGPEVRAKICRWLVFGICLVLCISIAPTMIGSVLSSLTIKIANGVAVPIQQ